MEAHSGVTQGSLLGPLLFMIFIDDLARVLESPGFLFADDLKPARNSKQDTTQLDLNKVVEWTQSWCLPLNAAECKQLIEESHSSSREVLGGGDHSTELEGTKQMRDLGVLITVDFKPKMQSLHAAREANGALNQLRRAVQSRDPEILLP